jgi:hypothetical protein
MDIKNITLTLSVGLLICLGTSAAIGATTGVTVQPNTIPESTISVPAEPKIKLEPQTPQPTNKPVPNIPEQQVKPKPKPEVPKPTIVPQPKPLPSKPKPEVPTQAPEIPSAPVIIEKPQIPEDQIRDIRRVLEEIEEQRKWREEITKEQLPGDETQEPEQSGRSVDDIIGDILSEAQESAVPPPTDKPELPPVLSESELKKYAVPISGGPAAEIVGLDVIDRGDLTETGSDLRPGTSYGYITEGDCIPIPGNPDPRDEVCVSDIYQCTEGECEKVGEQVQLKNCWESGPGQESCEMKTVIRECDSGGECVITSVRSERSCVGSDCENDSTLASYICVPPTTTDSSYEVWDAPALECPESSRRHRDNARSRDGYESAQEWDCNPETGRCEVTRTSREESEPAQTSERTDRYDCPDDMERVDLEEDCELFASSTTDSFGTTEETTTTIRRETLFDCTPPTDEGRECEPVGSIEERCQPGGSTPCTLTFTQHDGNLNDGYSKTTFRDCPEGTTDPERDCQSGTNEDYTCADDGCTGAISTWWEGGTSRIECRFSGGTDSSPCYITRVVEESTRTEEDGTQVTYRTEVECGGGGDPAYICRTSRTETRCSTDSSSCTTTRSTIRECGPRNAGPIDTAARYERCRRGEDELETPVCDEEGNCVWEYFNREESTETWTTECDEEGNCVREGEVEACQRSGDPSNPETFGTRLCGTQRVYRVEETCRGSASAEAGSSCEITSSREFENYEDGHSVTTETECDLASRQCTKAVTTSNADGTRSVSQYECGPATPEEPSPYSNCRPTLTSAPVPVVE